jgi:hypothetical protein
MKPFYQSKTVWVNVIGAGAMLLHGPLGSVDPRRVCGVAIALLNLALRFTTTQAVTLK